MTRRRVGFVFVGFTLVGVPGGAFGVAWPSVADALGRPVSDLGLTIVAFTVGFMAAGIWFERVDRMLGRGTLLTVGSVIATAALAGFAMTPTWWVLLGSTVGIGAGTGLAEGGLNSYAAANHGARVMNWAHAAFAFGAVLGPLAVTGANAAGGDWRTAFWAVASIQAALTAGLWLMRDGWPAAPSEPRAAGVATPAATAARRPRTLLWAALLMFFVYTGVEVTAGQWSFTVFTESRGIGEGTAGLLMSAFYAVFMTARIVIGAVGDRVSPDRVVLASMAGSTVLAVFYWWSPAAWVGAAALVASGATYAAVFPMLMLLTPVRLGEAMAAKAIGYQLAAAGLGVAAISGGAGLVVDAAGLEAVGAILFFGSALLTVIGYYSARNAREPATAAA